MISKIVANFQAGLRDDVPVPLGHDLDAIQNTGHVVALEQDGDRLFGLIQVKDKDIAEDLDEELLTGGSAMINLNYVDAESGQEHGPTLIHWAITNAPHIKGLAPYEAVALGEDAEGATFIALDETNRDKGGSMDPIKEALQKLSEASDEDLRKALEELRPDMFKDDEESSEEDIEKAKTEAAKEAEEKILTALSEKGITLDLGENEEGKETKAKVDVTKSPEYVALAEEVTGMRQERAEEKAAALIDGAIEAGKLIPAQKDALMNIALGEKDATTGLRKGGAGVDAVAALIPEKPLVDLTEHGVTVTEKPGVELSEGEAETEADRYLEAYGTKKGSDS